MLWFAFRLSSFTSAITTRFSYVMPDSMLWFAFRLSSFTSAITTCGWVRNKSGMLWFAFRLSSFTSAITTEGDLLLPTVSCDLLSDYLVLLVQ